MGDLTAKSAEITKIKLPQKCSRRGCSWQGIDDAMDRKPLYIGQTKCYELICPQCGCNAFYEMRPLFIPLKAKFFDAFKAGTKTVEYRKRGPAWNEATCLIGRRVVLSRGYGRKDRLKGKIVGFEFKSSALIPNWVECYGVDASVGACITIELEK